VGGKPFEIIVVGQGAAGLAAALSAVEEARARNLRVGVTLIDKASADEAGGNTRWTPAYMRMAAPDRVEPGFVQDMLEATQGKGDESYFECLAREAPARCNGSPRTASPSTSRPTISPRGPRASSPSAAAPRSSASSAVRHMSRVWSSGTAARPKRWSPMVARSAA